MAISERTRKFVMEITANGTSPDDAVKIAGLPAGSAPALINNPAIRREIDNALAAQGIDEAYFSSKLKELCEATTGEGDKAKPDWSARAKGLMMLKDIYGHDAPKKLEQTTTTITYEERLVMIANEEPDPAREAVKEITCQG